MERLQVQILPGALEREEVMGQHCFIAIMIFLLIALGMKLSK